MKPLLRWLLAALLVAYLLLTSRVVAMLNEALGGWALLLVLCALLVAAGSLAQAGRWELRASGAVLLGLLLLAAYVQQRATWSVSFRVDHARGPVLLAAEGRYVRPTVEPARIPFPQVNDAWAVLHADTTRCAVQWTHGHEVLDTVVPLQRFFHQRTATAPDAHTRVPLTLLLVLCAALLVVWCARAIRQVRAHGLSLRSWQGATLFVLLGLLVASVVRPPSTWLSNEFLSRPDDWLCYETGARALLKGNLFLMPPPGGVELWSLLYTPFVALMHALLGAAMTPIHVVQVACSALLVPLGLLLVPAGKRGLTLLTGLGLAAFAVVDVDLHYAWRLLSDVLPLLLLAAVVVAVDQRRDVRVIALLCGLLYLLRLEFIGLGVVVLLCLCITSPRITRRQGVLALAVLLACALPYFVRWYLLYGNLRPFPIAMEGTGHLPVDLLLSGQHLWLKFRAVVGDYAAINPDLRFRYHWLLVHAGFLIALAHAVWTRSMDRTRLVVLACFAYVLLTRMASPSIGIYGHRHSLALVVLELLFVVLVARGTRRTRPSVDEA